MSDDCNLPIPCGLHHLGDSEPAAATFAVDLSGCEKITDALRCLGEALDLPDYYGANLDALFDCLSDSEWLDGQPIVIRCYGMAAFRARAAEGVDRLLSVMDAASRARLEQGGGAMAFVFEQDHPALPRWPLT